MELYGNISNYQWNRTDNPARGPRYIRKCLRHFKYGQVNKWKQAKTYQFRKKKKQDPYLTLDTKVNSTQIKRDMKTNFNTFKTIFGMVCFAQN